MIVEDRVLAGPNVWSRRPVWEIQLAATTMPSGDESRPCRQRVCEWLALAAEEVGERDCVCVESPLGGHVDAAELLGWLVIELQRLVRADAERFWRIAHPDGATTLAMESEDEPVIRACWAIASRWLEAARSGHPTVAVGADIQPLRQLAFDVSLGATTRALCEAAKVRGIPVRRLDQESLIQLGHGAKQRRLLTTMTDRTASLADRISDDKWLTKQLLRQAGFPVAIGRVVSDADDAWQAACEVGLPCVVKPRNDDYGHGVSLRLCREADVRAAFDLARTFKPDVLVEQHRPGVHHRIFVMNNRVVAAVRRDPAQVVGDGEHTIAELVEAVNRDPRRNDSDPRAPLWSIGLNDEEQQVLADQQLTPSSIPAAGLIVPLRYDSRTSYGGTNVDCTATLHPDLAALVLDAVQLIGLDMAGVDLLADDVSRSPLEQALTFLEVNSAPSILPHVAPLNETPQPMCDWILQSLFPTADSMRFPIVAVGESVLATDFTQRLVASWPRHDTVVGRSAGDGVWLGSRPFRQGRSTDRESARVLLAHPRTEAAVCELAWASLRGEGLPFERCDIAVLLAGESNQRSGETPQSPIVLLARSAREAVIINVDDPEFGELTESSDLAVPISIDEFHPAITRARQEGRRAVFRRGLQIVLAHGSGELVRDIDSECDQSELALAAIVWILADESSSSGSRDLTPRTRRHRKRFKSTRSQRPAVSV